MGFGARRFQPDPKPAPEPVRVVHTCVECGEEIQGFACMGSPSYQHVMPRGAHVHLHCFDWRVLQADLLAYQEKYGALTPEQWKALKLDNLKAWQDEIEQDGRSS